MAGGSRPSSWRSPPPCWRCRRWSSTIGPCRSRGAGRSTPKRSASATSWLVPNHGRGLRFRGPIAFAILAAHACVLALCSGAAPVRPTARLPSRPARAGRGRCRPHVGVGVCLAADDRRVSELAGARERPVILGYYHDSRAVGLYAAAYGLAAAPFVAAAAPSPSSCIPSFSRPARGPAAAKGRSCRGPRWPARCWSAPAAPARSGGGVTGSRTSCWPSRIGAGRRSC